MDFQNTNSIINEFYLWDDADSNIESNESITDLDDDDDEEEDEMSSSGGDISTDYSSDSGISISSTWPPQSCDDTTITSNDNSNFISTVSEIARDLSFQTPAYTGALIDFTSTGLVSNDPYIRRSAAVFLWQLLRACNMPQYDEIEIKEKTMNILKYSTKDVIKSLECALELDDFSDQMLYWVSGCFHYISRVQYGCEKLWKCHLKLIISLLNYNLQAVVFYTVTTLHNMLLSNNEQFKGYLMIKCIELLMEKLTNLSVYPHQTQCKLLAILIDCLANISYHNEAAKEVIACQKSLGINKIVNYINIYFYNEKLLLLGLRLLKILSTNSSMKYQLAHSDEYINLLNKLFDSNSGTNKTGVCLNMLWTLRNLSDLLFRERSLPPTPPPPPSSPSPSSVINQKNVKYEIIGRNQDMLERVCVLLSKMCRIGGDLFVQCVAGVLANASCDCSENKQLLVKMKVPDTIIKCLDNDQFPKWSGETLEALYRCMHHLCSNHTDAASVVHLCFQTNLNFLLNIQQIGLTNSLNIPAHYDQHNVSQNHAHSNSTNDIPIIWTVLRAWLGLVRHLTVHPLQTTSQTIIQTRHLFFHKISYVLFQFKSHLDPIVSSICSESKKLSIENHSSPQPPPSSSSSSSSSNNTLPCKQTRSPNSNYLQQIHSSVILVENLIVNLRS